MKKALFFFFTLIFKIIWLIIKNIIKFPLIKIYHWILKRKIKLKNQVESKSFLNFLAERNTIHIALAIIIAGVIFHNFSIKTSYAENFGKNSLAFSLVKEEFDQEITDEIESIEFIDQNNQIQDYTQTTGNVKTLPIAGSEQPTEPSEIATTQGSTSILKPNIPTDAATSLVRDEIISYEVETGDTISVIAEKFGISTNTILWANNLSAHSLIRPGDKLSILPTSGISHQVKKGETLKSIANKYKIESDKILEFNKLANANDLKIGETLIIPGGKKIYPAAVASSYPSTAPASAKVGSSGRYLWPTSVRRISQYYSWRHRAVDIAGPTGTPLYATESGTVTAASWYSGYGNRIVINHGGGVTSLYGHLSKFYVGVGDKVEKGQAIGLMGSTGRSTGPHLHFELVISGAKQNPLSYIK